jgi:plasmid maintenance system antidote protein VapI
MKETNPLDVLRRFVTTHPHQRAAAEALGISQAYLSDLLNERRDLNPKMLAKLGLRQVIIKADKPIGQ